MAGNKNAQALPESPREFGFWLNGKSVAAGTRDVNTRQSPGHDVQLRKFQDVPKRMWTQRWPLPKLPLMTDAGLGCLGASGLKSC